MLHEAFRVRNETATAEKTADAVVAAVTETRDALDLPSRLRSVEGAERSHFPDLAQAVIEDPFMEAGPRGLEASQSDIEAVFERLW